MSLPPRHGAPAPGAQLGPYRIVRQLGMGGMGTVYEAVDTALNRSVALKVIASALAGDPGFRARFVREAQAQASLDSPHVVQVFAHGQADGQLYIASQLIPDGDLGAMLRRHGAPPTEVAADLIAQVADGLAEAHRIGLVHRDIKPANVLLRNRGTDVVAYLADFGIARQINGVPSITVERGVAGTPTYMAPELHTGGTAGPMSDVYSLGCLLWATLTGRAPYGGTSDFHVVEAHLSAPIPQLPGRTPYERELNRVLRTAMAKQPGERYPSAAAMRDDLRSLSRTTTSTRRTSRALVVTASAAVVALVAGAVVAAVLVGRGDADPAASGDPTTQTGSSGTGGTESPRAFTSSDEQVAVDNIARVLEDEGDLDAQGAECTARGLVDEHGIDGLIEDGLLDEDLMLVEDGNGRVSPAVLADIFATTFGCLWTASPAVSSVS